MAHLFSRVPNGEILEKRLSPLATATSMEKVGSSALVTHDARLSDPRILYDFFLHQAFQIPPIKVHCIGAHTEIADRDEYVTNDGNPRQRKKGEPDRIIDFDFWINLTSAIKHENNHYNIQMPNVRPHVPVHRGTYNPSYAALFAPKPRSPGHEYASLNISSFTDVGRSVTSSERALWTQWAVFRMLKGLPSFANMWEHSEFWDKHKDTPAGQNLVSLRERFEAETDPDLIKEAYEHRALKDWCEAYCADPGILKEFQMVKGIWGWDFEGLGTAIKTAIQSTGYQSNDLRVEFETEGNVIIVRPDNVLSKALDKFWVFVLCWAFMIYPFILLFKRLHPRGGAKWGPTSIQYSMKCYPPLPSTFPNESLEAAQRRLPEILKEHPEVPRFAVLRPGPQGIHYLLGRKEGEWFREWEDRIRTATRLRYKGQLEGNPDVEGPPPELDGY
ncbi:hypothetical protein TREMEDRAFT_72282 [Tremella mesenterica DSM 1558]|uniref:uncharacterized protein n=1 Tax=Tremella mesenterica (strain ATCC 24925 / CBS 8224 / DSM 1558 / NBRC 9311 / NRRL Y-6157 / RJB 2259-6 / UBC 559-6) TaxID=578456 RepID=UPI0003F49DD2|nr:uncharacterized protein TREMEDRAFT_72282 [Tremella mesenterica DSM 1558]EIW66958.1 hypothetical protein TREMEDRAFT_72282 [Tremella mesenterica DSM 1558]